MSGGVDEDTTLAARRVFALLMTRPLCVPCLTREAELSAFRAEDIVRTMRQLFDLSTDSACDRCQTHVSVHQLTATVRAESVPSREHLSR